MSTILVPYHHDDLLPAETFPLSVPDPVVVTPTLPTGDIWRRLSSLYGTVADTVAAGVTADGAVTVLSGDCLVALATLAGVQRAGHDPSLVWFDAHGDVHTLQTTTSGYLGGLSLRLALGAHPELLADPLGLSPVDERRTVLSDARDLDPPEAEFLAGSGIRQVAVADVGPDLLPEGPLVVHVDVDVVDASELPGLLFPTTGGPSAGTVLAACRRLLDSGRVVAMDVACTWRPGATGPDQRTRADFVTALTVPA
jgi:arginase